MPGLDEWLSEFWGLSTERQLGMNGIGPIPESKIAAVAATYGEEAETFKRCIRAMDAAYRRAITPPKEGEHRIMKKPLTPGLFRSIANG